MAVFAPAPRLDEGSVTLGREELMHLINEEARILGLSGEEAIAQVKRGIAVHGYIWDDISLLVSLLSE